MYLNNLFSTNDTERPKVKSVNSLTSKGLAQNADMQMGEDATASIQNKLDSLNYGQSKGNGIGNFVQNYGGAIGQVVNGMFAGQSRNPEGQTESTTRAVETIDATKDAIGQAIPIAGMFRQAEKLGGNVGQAVDGDKGRLIAEGYLSPIQTVGKLNSDDNISQKDSMLGSVATLALPFGGTIAGNIIDKANKKRLRKEKAINDFKRDTQEEIDYQNKQQEKALEKLRALKEAQLNYIPTTRYS